MPLLLALLAMTVGACAPDIPEQEIGDQLAASILLELPVVHDPVVDLHMQTIGERIAEVSDRPEQPYHFYVVNSPMVNAFSLPGGHIFVTRALLERTRTSGELAGVLAHEIAHVAAGHGVKRLQREMRSGSESPVSLISRTIFGETPVIDNPAAQLFDRIGQGLHSRKDEREADRLAIRYMVGAGFDPEDFVGFLRTLRAEEENLPSQLEWLATHPSTENRIRLALDKIEQLPSEGQASRTRPRLDAHHAVVARLAAIPGVQIAAPPR